jgi:hypothetical protein
MRLKESKIIDELTNQENILLPLKVKGIKRQYKISNYVIDAVIEFSIQDGPSFKAAVELLNISTPKIISQKAKMLRGYASEFKSQKLVPMIIAPYISKKESGRLLEEEVTWSDLSGNMLIKASPSIYIERTGEPNKYPDTSPIKNIYQGTSSLVGRALLLNPEGFSSLYEVVNFINERNGTITLATVSKVLKSLEENLIVDKVRGKICVKQPAMLLENLAEGYVDYSKQQQKCQYRYDVERTNELSTILFNAQVDYAYCGFYAAQLKGLGITDQITIFVKSIQEIKKALRMKPDIAKPDEEYGRVTFIETNNPGVWFNIQDEPLKKNVDDLELFFEMINDAPRGPKIANQLKERILEKFNGQ